MSMSGAAGADIGAAAATETGCVAKTAAMARVVTTRRRRKLFMVGAFS
jgi:hypothetical protein